MAKELDRRGRKVRIKVEIDDRHLGEWEFNATTEDLGKLLKTLNRIGLAYEGFRKFGRR